MSEWKLIASAPKDRPILLFGPYEDISVAEWRGKAWACLADGRHAIESQTDFGTEYIDFAVPTHWMPLPEPPAND